MPIPLIKPSFSKGELTPSVWGRVDMAGWHVGASVMRNCFVNYRGGASSRAGTMFVGQCRQLASASSTPPRIIRFQFNIFQSYILEFGDFYMRVIANGAYVTDAPKVVTGATQANPAQLAVPANGYSNGDWLFASGLGGMTPLNGDTFIAESVAANTFTLADRFGTPINSLGFPAYTSGGTVARISTFISPYAAIDLPYLKVVQSADVMTLTCVNQQTLTEYNPVDLERLAANNWNFVTTTFASSISPPATCTATATVTGSPATQYAFVVTAIDAVTGQESIASPIGSVTNSVNIATVAGSLIVTWAAVAGAGGYNIYMAPPSYDTTVPTGSQFGFIGQVTAPTTTFVNTNIVPDFVVTPPLHEDPFAGTHNEPSVAGYFQGRRVYAATINLPDDYFMSQTGAYTNFDSAFPPIDSDAITGRPWGQQINGIQWLQPMPGGLLTATGLDVWQVSGTSGPGSAITPSQQAAQQQESNGFSPTIQPLKINYSILSVQQLGTIVRDTEYNFWNNIYAGTDISILSGHLFQNFQLAQWAWAQEPFKIVWATRSDGKFLSLSFMKEQELVGWARHDTNGLVVGNAVATETPVDAPYFIVKRFIVGKQQWAYYIERMDNRNWNGPEDPWCVDCALSLFQPAPNATLSAAAAVGPGNITGGYLAEGGGGYTAPSAQVIDPAGTGSGGSVTLAFTPNGPITGFTFTAGQNYSPGTYVHISDPTGSGATLIPFIGQNVVFNASVAVFTSANVGDVIRIGGGQAVVSTFVSPSEVIAAIRVPILQVIPNDPNRLPVPAPSGAWTITTPVTTIANLGHLEGMGVAILADGAVIAGGDLPLITVVNGSVTLPVAASQIVVGLPFTAQLQSMHADIPGGATIQGKRNKVVGAVVRVEKTRGMTVGTSQPVASTLDFQPEIPWTNMRPVPDQAAVNAPAAAIPLFTGDKTWVPIGGDPYNWNGFEPSPGMVCAQQSNPLPMNVLAFIESVEPAES